MIKKYSNKLNLFFSIILLLFNIESCKNNSADTKVLDNKLLDNKVLKIKNFDKYYAVTPSTIKKISKDGTVEYLSGPLIGIKGDASYEPLSIVSENELKNIIAPYTYCTGNILFFTDECNDGREKTIFVNINKKNILDLSTGSIYKTDKNMVFVYANLFTNSCFYVGEEGNKYGVHLLTFENDEMISTFLYDCGGYGFAEGGPSFISDRFNNVLQLSDRNHNHYLIDKTGYILDVNDGIELNYDYGVFVKQNIQFLNEEGQWEGIENLKLYEPIISEKEKNKDSLFNYKLKWKLEGYEERSDKEFSRVSYKVTNDNLIEKVEDIIIITSVDPFEYNVNKENTVLLSLDDNCKSPIYIDGSCYYYDENDFSIKSILIDSKERKIIDSLDDKQFFLSEGITLQVIDSDFYSVTVKDRRLNSVVRLYDKKGLVNSIDEKTEIIIDSDLIYTVNKIPATHIDET